MRLEQTGHRVLIFSQMVMLLDVLQEYMRLRKFTYQVCGKVFQLFHLKFIPGIVQTLAVVTVVNLTVELK